MAIIKNNLRYRMYGLVPYNLSDIQKGIQFGHAVVEHMLWSETDDVKEWANNDKTFIILNGGTTNLDGSGTINKHIKTLEEMGVTISTFQEPDLGNQITAVVFLVEERVWDKELYPDRFLGSNDLRKDATLNLVYIAPETEEDYCFRLGGVQNVLLRDFLSKFRLA